MNHPLNDSLCSSSHKRQSPYLDATKTQRDIRIKISRTVHYFTEKINISAWFKSLKIKQVIIIICREITNKLLKSHGLYRLLFTIICSYQFAAFLFRIIIKTFNLWKCSPEQLTLLPLFIAEKMCNYLIKASPKVFARMHIVQTEY